MPLSSPQSSVQALLEPQHLPEPWKKLLDLQSFGINRLRMVLGPARGIKLELKQSETSKGLLCTYIHTYMPAYMHTFR